MTDWAPRRAAFRALHATGCFVLPNPWDIGSARRLEKLGFAAIASSSSAAALALGLTDYQIDFEQCLDHLTMLVGATDLPVNADFENGFADAPEDVAANVARAIATGVAGLSVEDQHGGTLYPLDLAVERIAAARAAINASGEDVMLVARTEGRLWGLSTAQEAVDRLVAYAAAGADCLYAPGVTHIDEIAAQVRAVAPKPLNVLIMNAGMRVADLAAVGVRRVSVGGALANAAWKAFDETAAELAEQQEVN
ncbi:isocitrate lyase/phosphoenolpyruvate mutase family protein [Sphingomonas sp. SUN039]|uniref:isocitrate lyase/PEP mutase family protein n=1 Tax=Sphingomonas sp. SUN039 TaxID=2937787 RepID=UPI0021647B06|nr:isocitrate lyase/phosphoenolpyruvate mutase family protein [Sphingomonas sp. SUN039]UVO54438.1 isocitrate lyase/phosphoenolpyruvate mutase family protein [Sphingomonas sp. SUN039]